jgi:DNA-binding transcriptional regulator YdaS (Cro superfamily)
MADHNSPIAEAVAACGGQSALAAQLKITPPMVYQWVRGLRPVPPKYAPLIESLSGVDRRALCPSFPWDKAAA